MINPYLFSRYIMRYVYILESSKPAWHHPTVIMDTRDVIAGPISVPEILIRKGARYSLRKRWFYNELNCWIESSIMVV